MKIIKLFFSIVGGFGMLLLVVAALSPSQYSLTREIEINKASSDVFNYIKYLKNMDNFSVWAKMDPNMRKSYKGNDGEVGFISSWDSDHEHVGRGEQEIMKVVEGKRLDTQLRFFEPFEAVDDAYFATDDLGNNKTKVTWGFSGNMPYPLNIMLLVIDMETELGVPLADGLKNLKDILEKE